MDTARGLPPRLYESLSELTLKPVASGRTRPDYRYITDRTDIWSISLGLLGTAGVCALTLLAGAQQAQAAPPEQGDDPIILTAPPQDRTRTELTPTGPAELPPSSSAFVKGPDISQIAKGIPGIVLPPRPPGNPWWWEDPTEQWAAGTRIDVPGGSDIETLVRGR